MEKCDLENMKLTLTVEEGLDCSGFPMYDEAICVFDEGLNIGILRIDCWHSEYLYRYEF
jgi:uncharacterized protein